MNDLTFFRLCRRMCGVALPRRLYALIIGLRPWFGLCPKHLGPRPNEGHSPKEHDRLSAGHSPAAHQAAKPMGSMLCKARAQDQERQGATPSRTRKAGTSRAPGATTSRTRRAEHQERQGATTSRTRRAEHQERQVPQHRECGRREHQERQRATTSRTRRAEHQERQRATTSRTRGSMIKKCQREAVSTSASGARCSVVTVAFRFATPSIGISLNTRKKSAPSIQSKLTAVGLWIAIDTE